MTIKIYSDRIDIGDFTLFEGNGGVQFGGVARAENFLANQRFQGSVAGYVSGGQTPPVGQLNTIDKFPFATDTNGTDIGDLSQARERVAGQSSKTHGYTSGGSIPVQNTIDKFSFSADGNASDVGDLTQARIGLAGQSSSVSGYTSGGYLQPFQMLNTIDKFPFATDTNAIDVGDLTQIRGLFGPAGQSSSVSGYASGGSAGTYPPTPSNTIDKFPFATNSNATDVGDLAQTRFGPAGQSSSIHGYTSGGGNPPGGSPQNNIYKFPFATDTNAASVALLSQTRADPSGQSSVNYGYTSGGYTPISLNTIDKFPFATDTNATDVGDLSQAKRRAAGQQI